MTIAAISALEWASGIRRKEYSCVELTQSVIANIVAKEPSLNALTLRTFEEALVRARGFDQEQDYSSVFGGVPWLMKDMIDLPNVPRSDGGHLAVQRTTSITTDFVSAAQSGGLNLLGLTNVPEFATLVHTQNERFGSTKNPWDSAYSPAGSSGGSAVAVAAGYVPMAHATCGAGSIRMPASYCGVFGYKPSFGQSHCAELDGQHDLIKHHHVITRTVKDSAAFLDLVSANKDARGGMAFLELAHKQPTKRRIAVDVGGPMGLTPEPLQMAALEHSCELLRQMGHDLVIWNQWPLESEVFFKHMVSVFANRMPNLIALIEGASGKPFADNLWLSRFTTSFAQHSQTLINEGLSSTALYFAQIKQHIEDKMTAEKVDLIVSPVQPLDHLDPQRFNSSHEYLADIGAMNEFMNYTILANATGAPAMSVPLYWPADHHPLGTHFYGIKGQDDVMMQLAFELEQAQPWQQHYSKI